MLACALAKYEQTYTCVCICVGEPARSADVSIPDAGNTMESKQRAVSRGLSAAEGSAAALNACGGTRVHRVTDATLKFIYFASESAPEEIIQFSCQENFMRCASAINCIKCHRF